jgi:hypothetical protein
MECEFCQAELKNSSFANCKRCGFPISGTAIEKENFRNNNTELVELIQETDSALSWARFAMLWPWLTAIVVGATYFLRSPVEVVAFFATVTISSFFIFGYFAVKKKPVAILTAVFVVLLMLTVYSLYKAYPFFLIGINWTPFLIPTILLIMFGNALFLMRKLERTLNEKRLTGVFP